eukprot:SAG11_NODE_85_length_17370_cov_29.272017_18_plen_224_part_00
MPLPLGESVSVSSAKTGVASAAGGGSTPPSSASSPRTLDQGSPKKPKPADAPVLGTRIKLVADIVSIMESPAAKGKLAELAAAALGSLGLGDRQPEIVSAVMAALLRTPDKLQTATGDAGNQAHFVVGKALVCAASGVESAPLTREEGSKAGSAAMEVEGGDAAGAGPASEMSRDLLESDRVTELLDTIFARCALPDKPRHRGAGCIWLLCVVQKLSSHSGAT